MIVLLYFLGRVYLNWLDESSVFTLRSIQIEGNDLLSDEEILSLGELEPGLSARELDLVSVNAHIRENPFVQTVRVHRKLPDRIVIRIEEKEPVALLKVGDTFYCVDAEGLVLPSKPGKLYDLPVLSGDFKGGLDLGAQAGGARVERGLGFLRTILEDRPELVSVISELVLDDNRELTLYLRRRGIPVRLGKEGYPVKIRCLKAVLERLAQERTFSKVKYVDMRFNGRIFVGMRG
jgi:cell division protein FtsQ